MNKIPLIAHFAGIVSMKTIETSIYVNPDGSAVIELKMPSNCSFRREELYGDDGR